MNAYTKLCRKVHSGMTIGASRYATPLMLILGVALLATGLVEFSNAQGGVLAPPGSTVAAGDARIKEAAD
ncbi:MAG: hypothetical protein KDD44_00575, partial [Bdellovibrionales bacterium]|nr:hypothetical protein [Bdellovibrionales bacterium]